MYCKYPQTFSQNKVFNALEVWKNCNFQPTSHFILQKIQDRAIVITEHQQELVYDLSNGAISNDFDPDF